MGDLYRDYILDHYRHLRNRGTLADPDVSYEEANSLCGDRIRLDLKLTEERVQDVRFSGHGCAISQASASLLTELIKGMSVSELERLGEEDVFDALGIELSPTRQKCALLPLWVLKGGLHNRSVRSGAGKSDEGR